MAAKELEYEDKEQHFELIKLLVPINSLSPQLQNEVFNVARVYEFKKKDVIFTEGDRDDFSFYLLDGEIELLSGKDVQSRISSGSESALYAMARLQPRQYTAKAKTLVTIMRLNRSVLDRLMVAEEQKANDISPVSTHVEVSDVSSEDSGDWMTRMLQSELFCRLPTANIQQLFALLEPIEYKRGDVIINQGDPGEHYYIIQEGRCEVSRAPSSGAKPIKLAELHAGDSFGEEALLTNATRNATIVMLTNGVLMQLSKDSFINLIKKPTLDEVSFEGATEIIKSGGKWLDVRFPNEHEESYIEDSLNIPLNMLRMQTDKLDKNKKYVIYCDTGGRSSAAAFLLTDRGFHVSFLREGLASVPPEKVKTKSAVPPPAAPSKATEKAAAKAEASARAKATEDEQALEESIRSSVIEVDLERTNIDLKEAIKKAREEDQEKAREAKQAQTKLEAEKKKLQADKEAAEKATQQMRAAEEDRIRKFKEEADKRLADEKNKIEEIYARNAQEMEKLQRMKQEAEEQIRKEREKLEREAAEAKKKNIEADKLKKQLEESRRALEEEAQKKRAEQHAMEQAIQAKAKAKLEAERRKLAEEVARTSEEMEKAQKARAMADAARAAAEQEAKKIISEYKKQFDKERDAEKERLQQMRRKLEEEAAKIQNTLKEIQKAKLEAESTRREAEQEARRLRDRQNQDEVTKDRATREQVEEEIKAVEAKLQEAQKNLDTAAEAEVSIVAVKEVNEQELLRQKQEEEELRKQVQADLAEFKQEENIKEEKVGRDKIVAHADHIKRIKERAAAAKRQAEQANTNLIEDVAAQLGKPD